MFDRSRPEICHALAIVTDPSSFADSPSVIGFAWHSLKQARGQRVRFATLPRLLHPQDPANDTAGCPTLAQTLAAGEEKRLARIRRQARILGHPTPNGGDAA